TTALGRATPILPFLRSTFARRVFPTLRVVPGCADADMLADEAIAALRRVGTAPFFFTVFFSQPHYPYAAPPPSYARFTDPASRGESKSHRRDYVRRVGPSGADDAGEQAQLYGLYEGTLASVDAAAARILAEVRRRGEEDDTLVIVLG